MVLNKTKEDISKFNLAQNFEEFFKILPFNCY